MMAMDLQGSKVQFFHLYTLRIPPRSEKTTEENKKKQKTKTREGKNKSSRVSRNQVLYIVFLKEGFRASEFFWSFMSLSLFLVFVCVFTRSLGSLNGHVGPVEAAPG